MRMKELQSHVLTWMNPTIVILSERSKAQRTDYTFHDSIYMFQTQVLKVLLKVKRVAMNG